MSDDKKLQGISPLRPNSVKLPDFKLELPIFKPVFNFKKEAERVKEKNISQELHDSW